MTPTRREVEVLVATDCEANRVLETRITVGVMEEGEPMIGLRLEASACEMLMLDSWQMS